MQTAKLKYFHSASEGGKYLYMQSNFRKKKNIRLENKFVSRQRNMASNIQCTYFKSQ